VVTADATPSSTPVPEVAPEPAPHGSAAAIPERGASANAALPPLLAAGETPPPTYRTRLAPRATLRYEVRRGFLRGTVDVVKLVRDGRAAYDTSAEIWLDPARDYFPARATLRNNSGAAEFDLLLERVETPLAALAAAPSCKSAPGPHVGRRSPRHAHALQLGQLRGSRDRHPGNAGAARRSRA
jgi:hypothetical protein